MEQNVNRLSGSHLISDEDHMGAVIQGLQNTQQGNSQAEQSQTRARQQEAGDSYGNRQQGGERARQSY